jgi:hypothetical protein
VGLGRPNAWEIGTVLLLLSCQQARAAAIPNCKSYVSLMSAWSELLGLKKLLYRITISEVGVLRLRSIFQIEFGETHCKLVDLQFLVECLQTLAKSKALRHEVILRHEARVPPQLEMERAFVR